MHRRRCHRRCEDYIDEANECAREAYPEDGDTYDIDTSFCEAYADLSGEDAAEAAALMTCYADAYGDADCSTTDGCSTAAEEISECGEAM